jgi:hypothetical protein
MATTAILAGPGDFLPVLFVLIAIASGIINFVKERRAAAEREVGNAGRGNAGRGNPNNELQSEIDAFLQEVSPDDFVEESPPPRPTRTQQQRRRRRASSDEEAERRRRVRARREHEKQQAAEDRKRQTVKQRHLETSDLGDVSDRHEVANRHVDSSVENRRFEDHIDGPSQATAPRATGPAGNSSVADLLQQPGGIRDAIMLNEILGPPVARRPKRRS